MKLSLFTGLGRLSWAGLLGWMCLCGPVHAFENLAADAGNSAFYLPSTIGGVAHFMGSANCGSCHDSTVAQCGYVNSPTPCTGNGNALAYKVLDQNNNPILDANGQVQDVSIREAWSATMMANSSRDPLWRAKVKSELKKHPALSAEINDTCTKCHAPMANADAKAANETLTIFDTVDANNTVLPGILNVGNARHDMAADGVSCSLCHQVKDDVTLGTVEGSTGGYKIDMTLAGANRIMYGPYSNIAGGAMQNNQALGGALRAKPQYSAHISGSKMCGTCHDLKTPTVDEDDNILTPTLESRFPEQMPYSEWVHSAYNNDVSPAGPLAKSCQQCHMARVDGVFISTQPSATLTTALQKKNNFAIHEFVGGNKLMLDIFNNNKTQLGVLSNNFAATMAATDTMLQSAGNIINTQQSGAKGKLEFKLRINSTTGHKLPSAYPSRRAIVHVQIKNSQGEVVWESGRINADGSVVGVNADSNPASFEPHYDLITAQDQVQVYESIMGDNNGQVTYTLLRGHHYLKDNRLLPAGFDKGSASDDVKVVGDALSDSNFVDGSDDVSYRIANLSAGAYSVKAEFIYQTIAYGYAQNLFADNDINEVKDFKTMFDASAQKSQLIAQTDEIVVNVKKLGDIDNDNDVDLNDVNAILAAKNTMASSVSDARDLNNDMKIDVLDSRQATLLCSRFKCAVQ